MNLLLVLLALINVDFSWVASTGNPKGYKIGVATAGSTAYVFTDIGAGSVGSDGKTHYLWQNWALSPVKDVVVKGYNDFGDSGISAVFYVGEPTAPSSLTALPK